MAGPRGILKGTGKFATVKVHVRWGFAFLELNLTLYVAEQLIEWQFLNRR